MQIVAGDYKLYIAEGTEQTVPVIGIVQHENFDMSTVENDIALLKIATPLTFDDYVQPIALPSQGQSSSGDSLVTGWGDLTELGIEPEVLQKVVIPIVSDEQCRAALGETVVYDSMICAGVPGGLIDSCAGDSGGPMVCDFNSSAYLCGIVSWGYGCGAPNKPGVYTEVAYFVDWIQANS